MKANASIRDTRVRYSHITRDKRKIREQMRPRNQTKYQKLIMDDDEHLYMSVEKKLKVYSIVQITSATVSILASATLIIMICRSHQKLSTPFHRLLLGLSIADIIASLAMSFASTLSPPDHLGWNGFGNMSLCVRIRSK